MPYKKNLLKRLLLTLFLLEIILFGSGQFLSYNGITARMVFFSLFSVIGIISATNTGVKKEFFFSLYFFSLCFFYQR